MRLNSDRKGVGSAAECLQQGGLVAFPTETVYGLGADARNDTAVARIYTAKNRPDFNPLIVHVSDLDRAAQLAVLDGRARELATAFWPGPLTLVLPRLEDAGLSPLVTAGLPSVAIRVPAAPLAQDLLTRAGIPIAAPSANPSGRVSAVTAQHVLDHLGDRVDAVLDGGPCAVGLESTILMVSGDHVHLLRPGGLPVEAIEQCLVAPLDPPEITDRPTAPGQLASHYAPGGALRLNVTLPAQDEVLLGFGPVDAVLNLSQRGDLTEAAANLFRHLQTLDKRGAVKIAVSPIPDHGLGRAINDRLRRAAAPRPSPTIHADPLSGPATRA